MPVELGMTKARLPADQAGCKRSKIVPTLKAEEFFQTISCVKNHFLVCFFFYNYGVLKLMQQIFTYP